MRIIEIDHGKVLGELGLSLEKELGRLPNDGEVLEALMQLSGMAAAVLDHEYDTPDKKAQLEAVMEFLRSYDATCAALREPETKH